MCALRSTEMLRCQDSERAQGAGVCLCDPGNPAAAGEKRKVPAFYTGPACSFYTYKILYGPCVFFD